MIGSLAVSLQEPMSLKHGLADDASEQLAICGSWIQLKIS
jgi:hypothetical protein